MLETPQQKFHRLQHEIRLLAEDINQAKVLVCMGGWGGGDGAGKPLRHAELNS